MAFNEDVPQETAARVSRVSISLVKEIARTAEGADGEVRYAASYIVNMENDIGAEVTARNGELLKHLTDAQKNALKSFIDAMHVKATTELIP